MIVDLALFEKEIAHVISVPAESNSDEPALRDQLIGGSPVFSSVTTGEPALQKNWQKRCGMHLTRQKDPVR
jgi:hypothetical protein